MAGMAGCAAAVVGQAEFLGQTLCNNHHRPTTTTTAAGGALQVVSLFGKKKPAAAAKKAVQKAVSKVNKPTNEELAKWYGMSDLFSSAPSFTHFIHSLSLSLKCSCLDTCVSGFEIGCTRASTHFFYNFLKWICMLGNATPILSICWNINRKA